MASVEDTNVVRVYSFGESGGRYYLAMEYVEGESLADRLRRMGPLSVSGRSRGLSAARRNYRGPMPTVVGAIGVSPRSPAPCRNTTAGHWR